METILTVAENLHQPLDAATLANRDDQTAANLELAPQCLWNLRPSCGDQDGVERRSISPSQSTVAMPHFDVGVP